MSMFPLPPMERPEDRADRYERGDFEVSPDALIQDRATFTKGDPNFEIDERDIEELRQTQAGSQPGVDPVAAITPPMESEVPADHPSNNFTAYETLDDEPDYGPHIEPGEDPYDENAPIGIDFVDFDKLDRE